jgi:GT2 family glycosyltransferase
VNAHPLVTIAVPAFNPEFFNRALSSALEQDYPALEILVCDDSPGAEIEALCTAAAECSRVPLRYVRNPQRLGFSLNLLACLEQAQGTLIKFLCDDDLLLGGAISAQAKVLSECPEISLVICRRLLCDADDVLLPSRPLNFVISTSDSVFSGTDLLSSISDGATNIFGGISHALMRRAAVEQYLADLVQDGHGFAARLDFALYACLLRRGNLCSLGQVLSLERLHPGRLSHQASMTALFANETQWLLQMLAASTGEAAPADGWVRTVALSQYCAGAACEWEELNLRRSLAVQIAGFSQQVGTNALSFAELYAEWLECRQLSAGQVQLLPKRMGQWPIQPRVMVVVACADGQEGLLRMTLDSVARQSYLAHRTLVAAPASVQVLLEHGEQHVVCDGRDISVVNAWLTEAQQADWLLLLQAGDSLHEHALLIMAERMAMCTGSLCMYVDEGSHDGLAPSSPLFKPDFNLDLMRSIAYVGRVLAFNAVAVRDCAGFDATFAGLAPHDMLWRLVEAHGLQVVEHIAEVLVHARYSYSQWLQDASSQGLTQRVVEAHLARLGVAAQVEAEGVAPAVRVTYQHAVHAQISILILAEGDLQRLIRCVESLLEHTAYGQYDVLLVANDDTSVPVRDWLAAVQGMNVAQIRCVTVAASGCAASLNLASHHARGEYLLLLNGNCVLFDKQWLHELMIHAQRPEVGVVGPKLLDSHGAVVSAGLVLGMQGLVGSPFVGCAANADSYMNRLALVQSWSALSLDCLLVRRDLFDEGGGLDTVALSEGLFDADLCLRVRNAGYLVVWTPFSRVVRVADVDRNVSCGAAFERDRDAFYARWLAWVAADPAYNPNLSLTLSNGNFEPGLRSGWDPFIARAMPAVLALPTNATAIGHYRMIHPFQELEREGWIQGRINYAASDLIDLAREKPDVVLFQGRYLPGHLEDMAQYKRFSDARRIYELDDYIIEPPKKNDHARNLPANMRELVGKAIGLCDRVVVSTEPLADALSSFHHDIRVVPNMLSASLWTGLESSRQRGVRPRVGWAGGTSHRGDLELLLEVVKTLAGQVDWVFFGMCPDSLRPYVKEFYEGVTFSQYPKMLASLNLDLALAPLEQNLFNDCKSNLRLLEYGACGYPVICTDTKAYAGYLPCTRVRDNTAEQWLDAIRQHLSDPLASYRQGDALREVVLRDYVLNDHHLQHWANAWLAD